LFNRLAAEPDIDLRVLFLAARDERRPYASHASELAFRWSFIPGRTLRVRGRWLAVNHRVRRALDEAAPEVLILGSWGQPACWLGLLYARMRDVPAIAWVESTALDRRSGSPPLEFGKRVFVKNCKAVLVPGRASAAYVEAIGVASERIVVAPNAVDLEVFGRRVEAARSDREGLRTRLGLDRPTLLFVGRLDREKGVDVLLQAVARLPGVELVVVGVGPDEDDLLRIADEAAPGRVRFLGFLDRDELPQWYAAADVFVLPSRSEPWGMTLNEAALAGLPLVATTAAGAAAELVDHERNGFLVPPGDVGQLAEALERILRDDEFREQAGARSREVARGFTPEAWATAVATLVRRIESGRKSED